MRLKIISLIVIFLFLINIFLTPHVAAYDTLQLVGYSSSYAATVLAVDSDNTYVYMAGITVKKVYQFWVGNMSYKAMSGDYGGTIYSVVTDGTYVYAAGATTNKIYKYWASNMSKKSESAAYGGAIRSLALNPANTYIFAGGETTEKVYEYWTSNLTKRTESAAYGGIIQSLDADATYVYAGGATTRKVYQYWISNMSKRAETGGYGGDIEIVSADTTYLYAGGGTTWKVYQYWKSNLTKRAESASQGSTIRGLDCNNTYVWGAGDADKIYMYWVSNMSQKAESDSYGGNIRFITIDLFYIYAVGEVTRRIYKYWRLDPGTLALTVLAYDEDTGIAIPSYNITVVNYGGTDSYYDTGCINPTIVYAEDCPFGENLRVLISAANYSSRTYLIDLINLTNATLYVYLPHINYSQFYILQALNEFNEPLDNVTVGIKRFINDTLGFYNVTNGLTDSNGVFNVYLIPDTFYIVTLIKNGYLTKSASYFPDPYYFGLYYPKIFVLTLDNGTPATEYNLWNIVTVSGTMYDNGTIKLTYTDILNDTINATLYTYELYNFTSTLAGTNYTVNGSATFWITGINTSRLYTVFIYINHSSMGYKRGSIFIMPINLTGLKNLTAKIEGNLSDIFGSFDLGYVKFFIVYLPFIGIICLGGTGHPGLGVTGAGLWLGFSSMYFSLPLELIIISPFVIAIGIILFIVRGGDFKI